MTKLASVESYNEGPIYDSCPEIRKKTKSFLKTGAMTQTAFLKHLGVASNSFGESKNGGPLRILGT